MPIERTPELFWLLAVTCLVGVMWVPYIVRLIVQMGFFGAMAEPTGLHPYSDDWPQRATRAHYNSIENLAVFAPLVFLVSLYGVGDAVTAAAAMVFFWARLAYYVVYTLQLPYVRTIAFLIGFGCEAIFALRLFGFV